MEIRIERLDSEVVFHPEGRLDANGGPAFLGAVEKELDSGAGRPLRVDLGELEYIDSAGAAVLIESSYRARRRGAKFSMRNLTDDAKKIFALTGGGAHLEAKKSAAPDDPGFVEDVGGVTVGFFGGLFNFWMMTAETCWLICSAPFSRKKKIRWDLAFFYMERAGWDAVPIISTIALLVGAVLAMQAAAQLAQYGVALYVADMVGISLTRELGPLITAVVVAGRSGSAFAAEIGTMKVNEEVDALETMGLSPIGFLVAPKFIALLIMVPCLSTLMNTLGIAGGFLIGVFNLGLAPMLYFEQTIAALHVNDIAAGLIKSFVFAAIIAATGCFRGMEVEGGADAVGRKTTSAVVTSIFLVILADAIFTSIFYVLEQGA